MILLPYGHDRYVYSRPWVTGVLIALNFLSFALSFLVERGARRDVEQAAFALVRVQLEHPQARVPPASLAPLPPKLRALFSRLEAREDYEGADGEGEFELKNALRRFTAAVESRPDSRFGYRPGRSGVLSVVTSQFMHGGISHLLGNMLFLWLMGAVIESFWNRRPFLLLYLSSAR